MAYLYGLVLASALFLLSLPANAQSIPATATTAPTVGKWAAGSGSTTKVFSTAVLACQDNGIRGYGWTYGLINTVARAGVTPAVHDCNWTAPPAPYSGYWSSTGVVQTCVASGGFLTDPCPVTYTCPAGYTLSGTMCNPPPVNLCAELSGKPIATYTGSGGVGVKTYCDTQLTSGDSTSPYCVVSGTADFAAAATRGGTDYQWSAVLSATGAKCDGTGTGDGSGTPTTPPPSDSQDKTSCPIGKVSGTVNGTTVCVDPGTTTPTEKKGASTTTTTNADGSTTQTSTNSTTTCTGAGSCSTTTTTTTTTTPAGGGTPTTATSSETTTCSTTVPGCGTVRGGSGDGDGEDDDPSMFGGSCGAPFACDGDAIMCAVALEQHKRNCSLFVDSSPESSLYESEKGKTGPQYANQNVPLSPSSFSQANALGVSAQCIQDKVITVAGSTITLPFSQICSTLQHLGTVLLFIAFLTAYRIVSRG